MANTYFTDLIGNKNFQNDQNYVFPQKDSVFKEVRILDARILGFKVQYYIFLVFSLFIMTFFFMNVSDFLGGIIGPVFILSIFYLLLYLILFLWLIVLQLINFMTFNQNQLFRLYKFSFKLYKNFFQEKSRKIYSLGQGIYLIDQGYGNYKKTNYIIERLKYLNK